MNNVVLVVVVKVYFKCLVRFPFVGESFHVYGVFFIFLCIVLYFEFIDSTG